MIAVQNKIAIRAFKDTLFQFELMPLSAVRAGLAGVCGVNFYDLPSGAFYLLGKTVNEHTPSRVSNAFVNATKVIFDHVVDIKVFNGNQAKAVHKARGNLMRKVVTLVSNTLMNMSYSFSCMPSVAPIRGGAGAGV